MKKIRIVISFFLATICLCTYISHADTTENYTFTTFHMSYGIDIPIAYWTGSDTSPTYHDLTAYPSATLYSTTTPAPRTYNCYTFAFIYDGCVEGFSLLDNDEIFLITQHGTANNDLVPLLLPNNNPCMSRVTFDTFQKGDLILYYEQPFLDNGTGGTLGTGAYTHAAYVTTDVAKLRRERENENRPIEINEIEVVSKWGTGNLYKHTVLDCPYATPNTSIVYGLDNNEITRTVQLNFFRPSHSYTYTAVVIAPPRPTMTPQSTFHFANCSACGAYHYEYHDYSQQTCTKCGYFNSIAINAIPEEVS